MLKLILDLLLYLLPAPTFRLQYVQQMRYQQLSRSPPILFWFYFGKKIYSLSVQVSLENTPLILSLLHIDCFRLNYQSLYKVIERLADGYSERVEMQNKTPYLVLCFLGTSGKLNYAPCIAISDTRRLRNKSRYWRMLTLAIWMKVLERPSKNTVDHCNTCQLTRAKPRRFLFSEKDDITEELNPRLEINVV